MNQRWDERPWWRRARDVLSVGLNVALNGAPDETTSSRIYRSTVLDVAEGRPAKLRWQCMSAIVEALFWPWDGGSHCRQAFNDGVVRAGLRNAAAKQHLESAACAAEARGAASEPVDPT